MHRTLLFFVAILIQTVTFAQDISDHQLEAQLKAQQLLQRRALSKAAISNYGYDALFYNLQLKILPDTRTIEGRMIMHAKSEKEGLTTVPLVCMRICRC
jgi:hypothetical protein